ncbi:MAG: RNA-binding protein [Spirochaetes bacterium]|nr:RNA-binding protein [Spirochaetota bacterium]
MSKKIYVGNMSYDTDESALSELFSEYGEVVSTKVIEDQFTGRSKGFAFIEMANEEDAIAAINAVNGKEVNGRELKVNEAHDKPKRDNFRRNNRY